MPGESNQRLPQERAPREVNRSREAQMSGESNQRLPQERAPREVNRSREAQKLSKGNGPPEIQLIKFIK
jgi:hypothetical protein